MSEPSQLQIEETVITASGWSFPDPHELWRFREILYFLTWRNLKVRYSRSILGIGWCVLQPLLTMIVFAVIFGRLGKMPSDGVPYPIFSLTGLIPWQLFAFAMTESSNSVLSNEQLITKVYFPRLFVPVSAVFVGLVDFAVAFVLLLVFMVGYRIVPTINVLFLPAFVVITVMAALGMGLWLSALNVRYRDVRYTLPFLTQLWLLATPVAYPSSLVPEKWRVLVGLNPMAGVVEGFRWTLLGAPMPNLAMVAASTVVAFVLLVTGMAYFRSTERSFVDII